MNRRIRNAILFLATVMGTALLFIGVVSVTDGDGSGWRAIIGAAFAFALAAVTFIRARAANRASLPDKS
jgi:hypothetical protein